MTLYELVNRIFPGLPALVELYSGKPFHLLYKNGELRRVLAEIYGEYGAETIMNIINKHVNTSYTQRQYGR